MEYNDVFTNLVNKHSNESNDKKITYEIIDDKVKSDNLKKSLKPENKSKLKIYHRLLVSGLKIVAGTAIFTAVVGGFVVAAVEADKREFAELPEIDYNASSSVIMPLDDNLNTFTR